jgi:hypothetical protein
MPARPSDEEFRAAAPRFLRLQLQISNTDWAHSTLPDIKRFLETLETEAATTQSLVDEFKKRANDLHHQLHRGTDHHNPFSKARHHNRSGGESDGELAEEERRERQRFTNETAHLEVQMEKVNEAKMLYDECVDTVQANQRAKGELKELLECLFAGSTPSYPSEDAIEKSLNTERAKANKFKSRKSRCLITIPSVQEALTHIRSALRNLKGARDKKISDFDRRIANQRRVIDDAAWHRAKAASIISAVIKYDPSIPYLRDLQLGGEPHWFSFVTTDPKDLIFAMERTLERPACILENNVLDLLVKEVSSLDEELRKCQVHIRKFEASLWAERTRIMTELAAKEGFVENMEDDLASDEPPPAYSEIA